MGWWPSAKRTVLFRGRLAQLPAADQVVYRGFPGVELAGRTQWFGELPFDVGAQDQGAQHEDEWIECAPCGVEVGAQVSRCNED